jgi:DnaJ-class molecular chaperone
MTRRSLLTLAVALLAARTAFAGWREEAKKLPPLDENDPKNFDNPYTVLGLDETNATDKQLKRAYRKLSIKYHPDKATGDKAFAEVNFQRVREAYEVLTDPKRRVLYEMHGMPFVRLGDAGKLQQNQAASYNFGVPLPMVYNGSHEEMTLGQFSKVCRGCRGQRPNRSKKEGCKGCGRCPDELQMQAVQMMPGFVVNQQVAVKSKELCRKEPHKFTAHIEQGVPAGHVIKFPAAGEQRPGLIPGDISLTLQIHKHDVFDRQGDNLKMKMTITLKESLLGFSKTFRHMDGRTVEVKRTDAVTRHGYVMTIRGEGMPKYNFPNEKGDLLVEFDVKFPVSLTPADKRRMKEADFA